MSQPIVSPTIVAVPEIDLTGFSEFALKAITFAQKQRKEWPNRSLKDCMTFGALEMTETYGEGREHLINIALAEIAARHVFAQT